MPANSSDDFDSDWESDSDWGDDLEASPLDPECEGVQPPDLSQYSWRDLAGIKLKMDTDGFTLELGNIIILLQSRDAMIFQPMRSAEYSTPSHTATSSAPPPR